MNKNIHSDDAKEIIIAAIIEQDAISNCYQWGMRDIKNKEDIQQFIDELVIAQAFLRNGTILRMSGVTIVTEDENFIQNLCKDTKYLKYTRTKDGKLVMYTNSFNAYFAYKDMPEELRMQYAEQFIDAVCPDVFEDKEKIQNGIFRLFDVGVVYALTICITCMIEDILEEQGKDDSIFFSPVRSNHITEEDFQVFLFLYFTIVAGAADYINGDLIK